ncbi:MAG TPA: hypothetical protein VNV60_05260 [Holophagaceae bacterium]|nr:hypothetical protein [Holophagaceae bacterium]
MIQAVLLSALMAQTPGSRQEPPPPVPQEREDGQPDPRPLLRFRAKRLQEGLGLDAGRAGTIAERWAQFDQEHFQRQRQIAALRLRFNDILMGPEPEDRKSALIRPVLDQFMDLRDQQMESKRRFESDIRQGLNPAQQARLILMVDDLNKQVMDALRARRQERRGF